MTKEELLRLQDLQRNSGLPLMKYLDKVGLKYSTYTYWKRKFRFSPSTEDDVPFAPVSLRTSSDVTLPVHTGNITLQFLNGVRVCLESSMGEFNLQIQSNSNLLIITDALIFKINLVL